MAGDSKQLPLPHLCHAPSLGCPGCIAVVIDLLLEKPERRFTAKFHCHGTILGYNVWGQTIWTCECNVLFASTALRDAHASGNIDQIRWIETAKESVDFEDFANKILSVPDHPRPSAQLASQYGTGQPGCLANAFAAAMGISDQNPAQRSAHHPARDQNPARRSAQCSAQRSAHPARAQHSAGGVSDVEYSSGDEDGGHVYETGPEALAQIRRDGVFGSRSRVPFCKWGCGSIAAEDYNTCSKDCPRRPCNTPGCKRYAAPGYKTCSRACACQHRRR
jgi:hypothetical protein